MPTHILLKKPFPPGGDSADISRPGRALRRHHDHRLKKKRSHYWGYGSSGCIGQEMPAPVLGKVLATAHPCSCWGCGNPRHWFGERSLQERRWSQEALERLLVEHDDLT